MKGNHMMFPATGSPVYYARYTDHTYCGVEQQRPRVCFFDTDLLRCPPKETTLYSSLRAHFKTKPFYPFRHPKTFLMATRYPLKNSAIAFYGLGKDIWASVDPRICARLSLAHRCMRKLTHESDPLLSHFLHEFMYQHFPAIINVMQHPDKTTRPFVIPHDHVRITTDVLPLLPFNTMGSLISKISKTINGVKMPDVLYSLIWALIDKSFTRTCAIRNIMSIVADHTFQHRTLVDLNMDVTMLYGFLGCYPSATTRATPAVAMAILSSFKCLSNLSKLQYDYFIFRYFHILFFAWSMYSIDHIESMPVLNTVLLLIPSRELYMDDVRGMLDNYRSLLNECIGPVATEIIASPLNPSAQVKAAWYKFLEKSNAIYEVYRSKRGKRYIVHTVEPVFSTISTIIRGYLRNKDKHGKLPAGCRPTLTRQPRGCHPILSQDQIRALYIVAMMNVSIAAYPIVEFLHIFRLKVELIDRLREDIVKFCCRGGHKNTFKEYSDVWLSIDPVGTMFFQQYMEFCSALSETFILPLPADIQHNQHEALKRRFQMHNHLDETFGRFYYCVGCQSDLSLYVSHPEIEKLSFHSIHSIERVADPTSYEHVTKFNNRCGRDMSYNISKQIMRVGGNTNRQVPVLNIDGQVICSGKKRHQDKITFDNRDSWCNKPVNYVDLVGYVLYSNKKGKTVCVECGAFCQFLFNNFTSEGPICSVHRPTLGTFFYNQPYYSVKDQALNEFLNIDHQPPQVWMCEIDCCKERCRNERNTISMHNECITIEDDGSLRFMRLCDSHYKTLTILMSGGRTDAGTYFALSSKVLQMLKKYGDGDFRKIQFSNIVNRHTKYYG